MLLFYDYISSAMKVKDNRNVIIILLSLCCHHAAIISWEGESPDFMSLKQKKLAVLFINKTVINHYRLGF